MEAADGATKVDSALLGPGAGCAEDVLTRARAKWEAMKEAVSGAVEEVTGGEGAGVFEGSFSGTSIENKVNRERGGS
ncbi:hypothetical protein CLOM_g2593 [Closterium sp. NIES-68]|nr:hypothetical protein CLOM_g2593 [Closterium sp. NIES-68]